MEEKSPVALVQTLENDFVTGTTTISEFVQFSPYDNINKIEAYLNSKHTSGLEDALGREKPFFNIVTSATNIWYRATDIDRKNIKIKVTKSADYLSAFIANIMLREWMRKEKFGEFLNEWGRVLSRYGSAVVKFVEKDGRLIPYIEPWNKLIFDPIDIAQNPIVSTLELTPAQLRKNKSYNQEMVESLINAVSARTLLNNQTQDDRSNYIKVYELHGDLPLSWITGDEEDSDEYVQQMHVISYVESGTKNGKKQYDEFCLVKGREDDPYMVTHLIKEDGRSMAIGAVEHLFDAQWMVNHSMKAMKDQLDLASKLFFQTSDPSFVGQNALSAMETGDILIHKINEPLTQANNQSHDLTSIQNFASQWRALAQEITSTPDSLRGNTAPSGTAWRQVEALQQEANSLFEVMVENKGMYIEQMMQNFIIPYIKKKLNNSKEIVGILQDHEINMIDSRYIKAEVTKIAKQNVKEALLKGEVPLPIDTQGMEQDIKAKLQELGNQRFFKPSEIEDKTWKDIFENFEWEVEVDPTGEQSFNREDLATLSTVLQTVAGNPAILQDPNAKLLFSKILSITGAVSPLELNTMPTQSPLPATAPTPAMQT